MIDLKMCFADKYALAKKQVRQPPDRITIRLNHRHYYDILDYNN